MGDGIRVCMLSTCGHFGTYLGEVKPQARDKLLGRTHVVLRAGGPPVARVDEKVASLLMTCAQQTKKTKKGFRV